VQQVVDVLLRRLAHKGLSPDEVPWLIRDVLNVVGEAGETAADAVNRRLVILGWDEEILDEVSLALILCLAEERDEGRAEHCIPS
jgi:hypothetical protein